MAELTASKLNNNNKNKNKKTIHQIYLQRKSTIYYPGPHLLSGYCGRCVVSANPEGSDLKIIVEGLRTPCRHRSGCRVRTGYWTKMGKITPVDRSVSLNDGSIERADHGYSITKHYQSI